MFEKIKNLFKKNNINEQIPPEMVNIAKLLTEVKIKGSLPCKLPAGVLDNLIIIANTPNWHLMLQGEIITNLNKIYKKWQSSLNQDNATVHKVGKAENFERKRFWQGTFEEFEADLKAGKVTYNDDIHFIEYTGEMLVMDEDAQMEEIMK